MSSSNSTTKNSLKVGQVSKYVVKTEVIETFYNNEKICPNFKCFEIPFEELVHYIWL